MGLNKFKMLKKKFSLIFILNYAFLISLITNTAYSQLVCNSEVKFDKLDKSIKNILFAKNQNL